MKVLGIDPSFVNTGVILLNNTSGNWEVEDMSLIVTEAIDTKARKNYDDFARARLLWESLQPWVQRADWVCVEVPQIAGANVQARSMWSSGITLGVLASIRTNMKWLTPKDVKEVVGSATASKTEMVNWAYRTYPHAGWPTRKLKGELVPLVSNHHIADALAAALAGINKGLNLCDADEHA